MSSSTVPALEKEGQKQSGGSRLHKHIANGRGKENQNNGDMSDDMAEWRDDEDGGGRQVRKDVGKNVPKSNDKWADIDAWDMDFEDVDGVSGSSSPTRR